MRVCVLLPSLDAFKGGNHLPLLAACDAKFTVVCGKAKLDGDLPKNITVISLNVPLGSYYGGAADADFATALLKKYPPESAFWKDFDVIHINQAMHPSLLEFAKTGVPFVYGVHHPVTADREVACEENGFLGSLFWKQKYRRLCAWQKELCQKSPHILTVSETVKARLVADYGADAKRIHVVHNGVDGDEFTPSKDPPVYDVIAVGSFLHPRKGFPYLLDAYRQLAAKGFGIADVGRRSPSQLAALKAIPNVTIHGTVPHEKLVELMRSSSVLLSTSLYEGFGLSLIEALACGHPAVAFGGGAVPEVLGAIDESLVVPVRDVDALVQRTCKALEKRVHGPDYREAVLRQYSMKSAAAALLSVYKRISGL